MDHTEVGNLSTNAIKLCTSGHIWSMMEVKTKCKKCEDDMVAWTFPNNNDGRRLCVCACVCICSTENTHIHANPFESTWRWSWPFDWLKREMKLYVQHKRPREPLNKQLAVNDCEWFSGYRLQSTVHFNILRCNTIQCPKSLCVQEKSKRTHTKSVRERWTCKKIASNYGSLAIWLTSNSDRCCFHSLWHWSFKLLISNDISVIIVWFSCLFGRGICFLLIDY